jgi:hypothetical protein
MNCSHCGTPLAQNVRFCSVCGAQASYVSAPPTVSYPVQAYDPRVSRNLQTLGTLWLIYAGLRALTGFVAILLFHGIFGSHVHGRVDFGWSPFGHEWASALLPLAFFSLLISSGLAALTGYALLTRQAWGRIFAIVLGVLALFHFPFGTALGIYTLWTLAPGRSGDEYASLAAAAQRV